MLTVAEKICTFCNIIIPIELFGICKHAPDGRTAACKKCRNNKYYHGDKETSFARNRIWAKNNRERSREIKRNWEIKNIDYVRKTHREKRAEKKILEPWLKYYWNIVSRVTNKSRYYFKTGVKNNITPEEVKILYFRDKAFDMRAPSIDRIDGFKDYEFANCRFIELKENQSRPKFRRELVCP